MSGNVESRRPVQLAWNEVDVRRSSVLPAIEIYSVDPVIPGVLQGLDVGIDHDASQFRRVNGGLPAEFLLGLWKRLPPRRQLLSGEGSARRSARGSPS